MADDSGPPILDILKAAAHPVRLALLIRASTDGIVHTADAKRLAEQDPASRSGGAQYHLSKLQKARLLARQGQGRYRLTHEAIALLRSVGVTPDDDMAETVDPARVLRVDIAGAGPTVDMMFPEGADLVATLGRRLRGRKADPISVRVTRLEP